MSVLAFIFVNIFDEYNFQGALISAAVTCTINFPLLIASYTISKRGDYDAEDFSLCSKRTFLFIIYPRQNIWELLYVMAVTPMVQCLLTYSLFSSTSTFVAAFLSGYCLLGEPIPEWTVYRSNGDFHLTSTHYQRVTSLILVRAIQIALLANG